MSIFGKIGNWVGDRIGNGPSLSGLKSSIRGTGNLASKAAPLVGAVNPLLGGALKLGGELAGGRNIGEAVKSGVMTGVSGAAMGGLGKVAGKIPGVGKLASAVGGYGGGLPGLPENIVFDGAGNIVSGGSGGGAGSALLGGLKSAGKFALDNPDLIGGAVAGVSGFKAGQQSDDLRSQAIAAMSERPDLSSIFADAGNPYNRYAQKPRPPKAAGRLAA